MSLSKLPAFVKRGFLHASSYRLNFAGTYLSGVLVIVFFAVLARFYENAQPAALAPYGDYFTFLLIGGVFARYFSVGMRHFGRELEHELAAGTIEPVMVTATPPALALLGPSLWMVIEGVLLMAIQFAIGIAVFGADFSRANWPAAILLSLLTITALNGWGVFSAAFVLAFKRADPLSWLVDVTIYMLAGVYFPVSVLPEALRWAAYLLPLSHALEGLRLALMRGAALSELGSYVFILLLFNAILLPAGLFAFRFALRRVKREGSLGHY
jgi:ABC-2 type transport system permease protein